MRVLMVISQFEPIIGGAEKQAKILAHALGRRGIRVSIVTGWWRLGTLRNEMSDGIHISRNFSGWGMFGIKGLRTLGVLLYAFSLGFYLLLHRKEYDILHVHQVLYPAFVSTLIGKKILKKRVLVKMACSGLTSDIVNMRRFPMGNLQLKHLIKRLDCLVSVNQQGIDEFQSLGFPGSKIRHIPNGVVCPSEGKKAIERASVVITTVRLDRQKGIDILLKAWSMVVAIEPTLELFILGKGPAETEFKELSRSLGIVDSVKFTGEVRDVEEFFKRSDIFVLASRAEGMSNSLLEALGQGLACIATNISGNSELMGGNENTPIQPGEFAITSNGILINPEDTEGLSKAIVYLARHRELRETLGRNARKHIEENYSIDLIAEKYIDLYYHILKGTRACVESAGS